MNNRAPGAVAGMRSTGRPLGRYGLLLGLAWAFIAAAPAAVAQAAAPASALSDALMDFDIPAQPLEAALTQYSVVARVSAVYPGNLPAGLYSAPVQGRYTREEALRRLLRGTGIMLDRMAATRANVFRLSRSAPPPSDTIEPARWAAARDGYLPRLQADVMQALCRDARTAPGRYGVMFEISVDAAGRPAKASLISGSGDARRDSALVTALYQMRTSPPLAAAAGHVYLFTLAPTAPGLPPPCQAFAGARP